MGPDTDQLLPVCCLRCVIDSWCLDSVGRSTGVIHDVITQPLLVHLWFSCWHKSKCWNLFCSLDFIFTITSLRHFFLVKMKNDHETNSSFAVKVQCRMLLCCCWINEWVFPHYLWLFTVLWWLDSVEVKCTSSLFSFIEGLLWVFVRKSNMAGCGCHLHTVRYDWRVIADVWVWDQHFVAFLVYLTLNRSFLLMF